MRFLAAAPFVISVLANPSIALAGDGAVDARDDASDGGTVDADDEPMPNLDIAYTNKGCTCAVGERAAGNEGALGAGLLIALLGRRRRT